MGGGPSLGLCACWSRSTGRPPRSPVPVAHGHRNCLGPRDLSPELLPGLTPPPSRQALVSLVLMQADGLLLGSLLGCRMSGQASDVGWGHLGSENVAEGTPGSLAQGGRSRAPIPTS